MTVTGDHWGERYNELPNLSTSVIRTYDDPLMEDAGFLVVAGNLFELSHCENVRHQSGISAAAI